MPGDKSLKSLMQEAVTLAPRFGRVRGDIDALRGRALVGDYRGVLQNARIVLEAILRDLALKELKLQPGKQMLDDLVSRFQQQVNAQIVPAMILGHMRTVQAWGNLGSHDQASGLFADHVALGESEALTSANSLLAILNWYAEKYLGKDEAINPDSSGKSASSSRGRLRPRVLFAVLLMFIVAGTSVTVVLTGQRGRADHDEAVSSSSLRRDLDSALSASSEPAVPSRCRTSQFTVLKRCVASAQLLVGGSPRGAREQDLRALDMLENCGPECAGAAEYWYLLGRARLLTGKDPGAVAEAAARSLSLCDEFASAHNLAGTAAFVANRTEEALTYYRRAASLDPSFDTPRTNEALVLMKTGHARDAIPLLGHVLERRPGDTDARFARGQARLLAGAYLDAILDLEESAKFNPKDPLVFLSLGQAYSLVNRLGDAQAAFCTSKRLGSPQAAQFCRE
jgi:tetratricopeptide (TPR) repeat protein